LLSLPFLSLYVASLGAVLLYLFRQRFGEQSWFPIAVGIVAALAIIPLRFLLTRSLMDRSTGDWGRIVFFFLCGLFPFAGIPFLGRKDLLLICGMMGISALFFWAALGTLFQWPGFRRPLKPNECRKCRFDLTKNVSGVCPECGTAIENRNEISK
jgi:uncharacterized membrane protein